MEKVLKYTGEFVDMQELCDLLTCNGYRLVREPDPWDEYEPFESDGLPLGYDEREGRDSCQDASNIMEDQKVVCPSPNYFVIEEMIQYRASIAQKMGISAGRVLKNMVIKSVAIEMPSTTDDLFSLYGVGTTTVERYGQDILDIVERCRSKQEDLSRM